jgi:hypothetical protein
VEGLERVAAERDLESDQLAGRPGGIGGRAASGRLDEEVEQHRRCPGQRDEHVAAGAEAGEQRFAGERREHRTERRVDRVAAGPQHLGARPGRDRMTGRDDTARAGHRGPGGRAPTGAA